MSSYRTRHYHRIESNIYICLDNVYLERKEDWDRFELKEIATEEATQDAWQHRLTSLERSTTEEQTEEAQLADTQKQLRAQIATRCHELAHVSLFWDVLVEKEKALQDAQRVWTSFEARIVALEEKQDKNMCFLRGRSHDDDRPHVPPRMRGTTKKL